MTIRIASGLEHLVVGVREYLESFGVTAVVAFGKKALTSQVNQGPGRANRIVFAPADPKSGASGRLLEPSQGGEREIMSADDPEERVGAGRALWDWERDMVVSVWAYDGTRPEDELAQEVACESLVEWMLRAVHDTAKGSAVFGAVGTVPQGERKFGVEVRIAMRFTHPLYDVPSEVGHPGFSIERG